MTGIFLTFEGVEGSGKSSQARTLYRKLGKLAVPAILTHEPGGTPLGEKITRLLKWETDRKMSAVTEMLLFNASRSHHIERVIAPALQSGKMVVCDRFTDSTVVYQGYARGMDISIIDNVNNLASHNIKPDLTILLDVPAETGLDRKAKQKPDRFHQEDMAFHRRIRTGFLELAAKDPGRWFIVDGTRPKGLIASVIWKRVSVLLEADR